MYNVGELTIKYMENEVRVELWRSFLGGGDLPCWVNKRCEVSSEQIPIKMYGNT